MNNTLYHRTQKPWVYPMPNNKVGVVLRAGKNQIKKVEIIYGDPMSGWSQRKWFMTTIKMKMSGSTKDHDMWEGKIDNKYKRYRYAFKIYPKKGKTFLWGESGLIKSEDEIHLCAKGFTYSYWSKTDFLKTPNWFKKTSWYQIFPDRFYKSFGSNKNFRNWDLKPKGHEIYGGNIKGIIEKLPHIKKLGFNGIYLTPIFEAKTSHRYETKDYYKIDPILGTEKDLKNLIRECHKLEIKIMLDGVFNHIGYHSKEFQDVLKNKEKSIYKDWFWINDFKNLKQPNKYKKNEFENKYPYETFATVPEMPRLNWENNDVKKHLIKAAEKWTKMGIDGWRLDVSFEPPIHFWREFHESVKAINPEILIIGEVWWDSILYLESDIWHGVMNYPIRDIFLDYIKTKMNLKDKENLVNEFNRLTFQYTPEQQWGMFNLMSSHDVERLINLVNNDENKYKLLMKMCYLQPGSPSTYYGQEIGLEGGIDPDNRRTYPWDKKQNNFFSFFRDLNKERQEFSNTSDIFDRFLSKIEGDKIIFYNSSNKIIIDGYKITRKAINDKNSKLKR